MIFQPNLPIFLTYEQIIKVLSSQEVIVVDDFNSCHPVGVVISRYLKSLQNNAEAKKAITFRPNKKEMISGHVDKAYATETVDLGSSPDQVKSKTMKIGFHSFPA